MFEIQSDVAISDNIYECEAKRPIIRGGVKVRDWLLTPVNDVITENLNEYRCKDCYGKIKLHGKHVAHASAPTRFTFQGRILNTVRLATTSGNILGERRECRNTRSDKPDPTARVGKP